MTTLASLAVIFAATFVSPFAQALEPLSVAFPQNTNFVQQMKNDLAGASFSTEPAVAAITSGNAGNGLQVYLNSAAECIENNSAVTYRLLVTNSSAVNIDDVIVRLNAEGLDTTEVIPPYSFNGDFTGPGWIIESLGPGSGNWQEYTATFSSADENPGGTITATAENTDGRAITSQTINSCAGGNFEALGEPLPNKQPAIVCDPADLGCAGTFPALGKRFQDAGAGPEALSYGVRFREAITDILPGECRVVEDDIITSPEFHDGLNRRGNKAAGFLFPIYRSSEEFRNLVTKNEIKGFDNIVSTRKTLSDAHQQNWDEYLDIAKQLKEEKLTADEAANQVREQATAWNRRITDLHEGLQQEYDALQDARLELFDPATKDADKNAGQAIGTACDSPPAEGVLAGSLAQVKQVYERNLEQRATEYGQTQTKSQILYREFINSLPNLLNDLPSYFDGMDVLMEEYQAHKDNDAKADNEVRITSFETALDGPKTAATNCQKEKDFGPKVATTWCESGASPEFIISGRSAPAKARSNEINPPQLILGDDANIRTESVSGDTCGGKPGDPYWAPQCQCKCGDLTECPDGFGGTFTTFCGLCYNITRHDIFVTSQAECFNDGDKHADPFF